MVLGAAMVGYQGDDSLAGAAETVDLAAINASSDAGEGHLQQSTDLSIDQTVVVERYPSGRVKTERQVALDAAGNFVNHGEYRAFNEEGRLIGAGTYNYGKREGEWAREYQPKECQILTENPTEDFAGPFTSTATFHNDQLHGEWTITDAKNRPLILWQFANGERHGQAIWFNADGSTRRQMQYSRDQIVSNMVATGAKNEMQVAAEYVDGRELVREVSRFSNQKKVKSEGYVLKPRETSKTTYKWWEGRIDTEVVAKEGSRDRHGEWRFWHENGNLEMQGNYERGEQTGRFVWWHENGQKLAEGEYVQGKMQGPWQTYYSNGSRKSAGQFVDGSRHGTWMSWHENGMPKLQASYDSGTMMVAARKWDETGRLIEGNAALASTQEIEDGLRVSQNPEQETEESETETR
jgi:antitoxin component YwqK of YwqJK toxin-antitoxin module